MNCHTVRDTLGAMFPATTPIFVRGFLVEQLWHNKER
nr:MAG TPA: hypothetical protein [Caudoviricetes sp.]